MFIYFFIYLFSFFFSFCYSKSKDKYASEILKITTFLVLWLPLAFRCHIGTDYDSYVAGIDLYMKRNINPFEIGYIPFYELIKVLNLDYQFFFVITSFITILMVFLSVEKKYMFLAVPAFVTSAYLSSFNTLRQTLACVVMLYAAKLFLEKKYLRFILFSFLAFCYHKSAIVLAVIIPMANLNWKIFNSYTNTFLFVLIFVCFKMLKIANIILNKVVGRTSYANYLTSHFNNQTKMGSGLGLLLWLLMILCILMFSTRKTENNRIVKKDVSYNLCTICLLGYEAARIMASQIHIFNRVNQLFYPFYILFVIVLYNSKSRYRKLALIFLLFTSILQFFVTIKGAQRGIGGLGINPYESIF